LVGVSLAAVHGAVLKSSLSSVEAGRVLPLQGAEFHAGTFSLVLVGVFDEYSLGDVVIGESGTFSIDLEISASLRPGQYQVVAFTAEGEREAALDMSVAAASAAPEADHADADVHAEAMGVEATAEEMVIERSMAGAGWGVIGLLIGLAGGVGAVLVRRTPVTEA
jgi:hypothetical protein